LPGELPEPVAYEILVESGDEFWVFEVNQSSTFAPPRVGRRVDGSKRGYIDGAESRYQLPRQRVQRNARLVIDRFDGAAISVVALFDPVYLAPEISKSAVIGGFAGGETQGHRRHSTAGEIQLLGNAEAVNERAGKSGGALYTGPALAQCIRSNKKSAGVDQNSQLTVLDCTNYGITSLQGIDAVPNLQILILDQNPVSDLGPLTALANLETLSLVSTNVPDFGPLSALTYLQSVNLSGISGLSSEKSLDLAPLANLPYLEEIIAIGLPLDPLPTFAGPLREVLLSGSTVNDISGLYGKTMLERVSLSNTQVGDINALIEIAEMSGSALGDVDLSGLDWLYCPQINRLTALIEPAPAGMAGVSEPTACEDSLPVPHLLSSVSNVVYSDNFTLSWQIQDAVTAPVYAQLERTIPGTHAAAAIEAGLEPNQAHVNTERLEIGLHYYNVRLCVPAGAAASCGGASETFAVHRLGDRTTPISAALGNISDPDLRQCLSDATIGADEVGEVTQVSCRSYGVGSTDRQTALTGLDQFSELVYLDLADNSIGSLTPIRNLLKLSTVDLSLNPINDSAELVNFASESGVGEPRSFYRISLTNTGDVANNIDPVSGLASLNGAGADEPPRIQRLFVSNNAITQVPSLVGIEVLDVSGNQLRTLSSSFADAPPTCTGACIDPSSSLTSMNLAGNNLGTNATSSLSLLRDFVNLQTLLVSEIGLKSLAWLVESSFGALTTLDISGNQGLDDLGRLANLQQQGLTLLASELPIVGIGGESGGEGALRLPVMENLESLVLNGAQQLVSLRRLDGFINLSSLAVSDSQLGACEYVGYQVVGGVVVSTSESQCEGLEFLDDLRQKDTDPSTPGVQGIGLWSLTLANNGFNSLAPLSRYFDWNPLYRTQRAYVFTFNGEGSLSCEGLARETAPTLSPPSTCIPDPVEPESFNLAGSMTSAEVEWSGYRDFVPDSVKLRAIGASGSVAEMIVPPSALSASIDGLSGQIDSFLALEIESCVGDLCGPPSPHLEARYPLLYPIDVATSNAGTTLVDLSWSYPALPPANQSDVGFRFRPFVPSGAVSEVVVPPGAPMQILGISAGEYPGGHGRLEACEFLGGTLQRCRDGLLVSFRGDEIDPTLSVPEFDVAAPVGNEFDLAWDTESEDTHYRVEELVWPVSGSDWAVLQEYSVEGAALFVKRASRSVGAQDFGYRVQRCQIDTAGIEFCSAKSSVQSHSHAQTGNLAPPIAPVADTGANSSVCWFENNGGFSLRWSYDWQIQDSGPPEFGKTPTHFELIRKPVGNTTGWAAVGTPTKFSQAAAAEISSSEPIEWYWESAAYPWPTTDYDWSIRPIIEGQVGSVTGLPEVPIGTGSAPNPATRCSSLPAGRSAAGPTPDDIKPGHYVSEDQLRQGWRFFWSSSVRFDEVNDSLSRAFDLFGVWYTYKIIDGEWSPVWYYTRMQAIPEEDGTGRVFEGALLYPQQPVSAQDPATSGRFSSRDLKVGTVRLLFEGDTSPTLPGSPMFSGENPWIEVNVTHGDGLYGHDYFVLDDYSDYQTNPDDPTSTPFDHANLHSHWNGIWTPGPLFGLANGRLGVNEVFSVEWIAGDGYSTALNTFDVSGDPIWLIDFQEEAANPAHGDWRLQDTMLVPFPGFSPFVDEAAPDVTPEYMDWIGQEISSGGLARSYLSQPGSLDDAFREGEMCWNIDLTLPNVNGQAGDHRRVNIEAGVLDGAGFCGNAVTIRKVASLHHIDWVGPAVCLLGAGPCEYRVSWLTEDQFPGATPMVQSLSGGLIDLNQFCENQPQSEGLAFGAENIRCVVANYDATSNTNPRFVLVSNHVPGTAQDQQIIARSKTMIINNSGSASPAPVLASDAPSPVSPGAADDLLNLATSAPHAEIAGQVGDFNVTQGGAAEYVYPIMTAQGRGGLSPHIALRFNSQSGPGQAGHGWNLSGVPVISRCGQTWAQDFAHSSIQLNDQDRFCLDGQRLMFAGPAGKQYGEAGTEYRLEINNHTRFLLLEQDGSGGAVKFFAAQSRDGLTRYYGSPESSSDYDQARIDVPGGQAQFAWPLSRVQDTNGNFINYVYDQGVGSGLEWVLDRIEYTMNEDLGFSAGHSEIDFVWADLPQPRESFVAGIKLSRSKYIREIRSTTDQGQILRKYVLRNETERTAAQEPVLEAIDEYYTASDKFENSVEFESSNFQLTRSAPVMGPTITQKLRSARAGDVDGDGREEIVFLEEGADPGNGQDPEVFFGYYDFNVNGNGITGGTLSASRLNTGLTFAEISKHGWTLADLHGDGTMGILYFENFEQEDLQGRIKFAPWVNGLGSGPRFQTAYVVSSIDVPEATPITSGAPVLGENVFINVSAADLNGDGLSEVIALLEPEEGSYLSGATLLGWAFHNMNHRENGVPGSANWSSEGVPISVPSETWADPNPQYCTDSITGQPTVVAEPLVRTRSETAAAFSLDGSGQSSLLGTQLVVYVCDGGGRFAQSNGLEVFTQQEVDTLNNATNDIPPASILSVGPMELDADFECELPAASCIQDQFPDSINPEFIGTIPALNEDDAVVPVDFNGDGLTDVVHLSDNATIADNSDIDVYINKGFDSAAGAFLFEIGAAQTIPVKTEHRPLVRFNDVNGDKFPDLVFFNSIGCSGACQAVVMYSDGVSFVGSAGGLPIAPSPFINNVLSDYDAFFMADIVGNGRADAVGVVHDDGVWKVQWAEATLIGAGANQALEPILAPVTRITDGYGANTSLSYLPLSSSRVYRRDAERSASDLEDAPIYDLVYPEYVVSLASSSAPQIDPSEGEPFVQTASDLPPLQQQARTEVRYLYTGAKIQGYGRGMLGFREMATYSQDTKVLSISEYGQEFPLTGLPKSTSRFYLANGESDLPAIWSAHDGGPHDMCWQIPCTTYLADRNWTTLSESETVYAQYWDGAQSGSPGLYRYVHVYPEAVTETSFDLRVGPGGAVSAASPGGSVLSIKVSETTGIDEFGHVLESAVTTMDVSAVERHRISTTSTYANQSVQTFPSSVSDPFGSLPAWLLGRLKGSCVSHWDDTLDSSPALTGYRASAFDYDPNTGQLVREISGAPMSSCASGWEAQARDGDQAQLFVDYGYDEAGNQTSVVRKFADGFTDAPGWEYRASRTNYDAQFRYPESTEVFDVELATTVPTPETASQPGWRLSEEVLSRDQYGNVLSMVDELGLTHSAAFYPSGAQKASWGPYGDLAAFQMIDESVAPSGYCPGGGATRYSELSVTRTGRYELSCKDLLGRDIRTVTRGFSDVEGSGSPRFDEGPLIYTDMQYDFESRPVAVSEPYFSTALSRNLEQCEPSTSGSFDDITCLAVPMFTRTIYDDIGRVFEIFTPYYSNGDRRPDLLHSSSFIAFTKSTTDPSGFSTSETVDSVGRKVYSAAEHGGITSYRYDAFGQLEFVDGPMDEMVGASDQIELSYSDMGHKQWMEDPDKGAWYYAHNALGELVCQTDAEGNLTVQQRDSLGRVTRRTDGETPGQCARGVSGQLVTSWIYHRDDVPDLQSNAKVSQLISSRVDYAGGASSILPNATPLNNFSSQTKVFYDALLARPMETQRIIGGRNYVSQVFYDSLGRTKAVRDTTGSDRGEQYLFSVSGHAFATYSADREINASVPLHSIQRMNSRGDVIEATLGNGVSSQRLHDPARGGIQFSTDQANGSFVTLYEYQWDRIGNLKRRDDLADGVMRSEFFGYDQLTGRRLESVWATSEPTAPAPGPVLGGVDWELIQSMNYSAESGNLQCKRDGDQDTCFDFGSELDYEYDSARPHAVLEVSAPDHSGSLVYNSNGDMVRRQAGTESQAYAYSSFSKLEVACDEVPSSTYSDCTVFAYGADRARVAKWEYVGTNSTPSKITHYVGGNEFEYLGNALPANLDRVRRHFAGGGLELIEWFGGVEASTVTYRHFDSLGSIVAISDQNGNVDGLRMSFDAWGQRRNPWTTEPWRQWVSQPIPGWSSAVMDITPRGYTGHEHLDRHGLIHMNGRVYDPLLGRFLQADPFVEDVGTLNRYTYVLNNPLSYSDPSGYFSFNDFVKLTVSVAIGFGTQTYATALWADKPFLAIGVAAAGGGAAGAVNSGSWDGALSGAFVSSVSFGIGNGLKANLGGDFIDGLSEAGYAAKIGAHGVVGGVVSEFQGGKFGHGFAASAVTAAVSPHIHNPDGNEFAQMVLAGLVGGSVAEISGGKFANGALTSALQFAFNQAIGEELARLNRVQRVVNQLEELEVDQLEVLFNRSLTEDQADILVLDIQTKLIHGARGSTEAIRDEARAIIESEYKGAAFGRARGLGRRAVQDAISKRLGIDRRIIEQLSRSQRVIDEVDSIDPTLKGVIEGIQAGNADVLEVWESYYEEN